MTRNRTESSKENPLSNIVFFVTVAATVMLTRIPFLGQDGIGSEVVIFNVSFFPVSKFLSVMFGPVAFGVGCAFFYLALHAAGFRDAMGETISLALLPVAFLKSVDSSAELLGVSIAFAGLYFLMNRKMVAGGILVALAASVNVPTMLVLIGMVPVLKKNVGEKEGIKAFGVPGILIVSFLFIRMLVEFVVLGAVRFGLTFEPITGNALFRLLTFEGYGVLCLFGFAVCLISIVAQRFWTRAESGDTWWLLAVVALSCLGVFVLSPKAVLLLTIAIFLLMISGRVLPRVLNWGVLFLVAASSFFLMVSRIPPETTLFSSASTTLEVRNRKLYVDALQGPVRFEYARLMALNEELQAGIGSRKNPSGVDGSKNSMWVTGYYPVWSIGSTNGGTSNSMYPHEMNWQGLTHLIHFNVGPDSTAPYWHPSTSHTMGTASSDSMEMFFGWNWRFNFEYRMLDSLKKYAHASNVKLLLSVGGIWGAQAQAMDYITSDSMRTQTFVNAAVAFSYRNGYDGIEIDYEPPRSEIHMSRLTRIMKRKMTTVLGKDAPLVLAACFECTGAYSLALQDSIAQYNFMMYDMHQPFNGVSSGGKGDPLDVTGFNSALYPPDKDKYPVLASWGYNYDGTRGGIPSTISPRKFMKMGFSPGKIGMGVPFYGYIYSGKNAPNQSREDIWPQYLSYIDCIRASRIGGMMHWEEKARVPWIGGKANLDIGWMVKPGQQFYITYDDSASLTEKVRWAKQLGLGGVMIYELWTGWVSTEDQGRRDPLLRAVVEAVHEQP